MRSAFQDNRLEAHRSLKTAKHENQQKDCHDFACHIDTHTDAAPPRELIFYKRAQKPDLFLL